MRVKILADTPFRVSSAISQHFKRNSTVNLPRQTAESLIEQGIAAPVGKPSKQGD